jgi:hypothetical protein
VALGRQVLLVGRAVRVTDEDPRRRVGGRSALIDQCPITADGNDRLLLPRRFALRDIA